MVYKGDYNFLAVTVTSGETMRNVRCKLTNILTLGSSDFEPDVTDARKLRIFLAGTYSARPNLFTSAES